MPRDQRRARDFFNRHTKIPLYYHLLRSVAIVKRSYLSGVEKKRRGETPKRRNRPKTPVGTKEWTLMNRIQSMCLLSRFHLLVEGIASPSRPSITAPLANRGARHVWEHVCVEEGRSLFPQSASRCPVFEKLPFTRDVTSRRGTKHDVHLKTGKRNRHCGWELVRGWAGVRRAHLEEKTQKKIKYNGKRSYVTYWGASI